jgi:hypothetical protein
VLITVSLFSEGNGGGFESDHASNGASAAADRDSGDELSGTEEVGILLERIRSRPTGEVMKFDRRAAIKGNLIRTNGFGPMYSLHLLVFSEGEV